jgi:hypothetical protein
MASDIDRIGIGPVTLTKRLAEGGFLKSEDKVRKKHTTRRTFQGKRVDVLHVSGSHFGLEAQSAHSAPDDPASDDAGPEEWADSSASQAGIGPQNRPTTPSQPVENGGEAPTGPIGPVSEPPQGIEGEGMGIDPDSVHAAGPKSVSNRNRPSGPANALSEIDDSGATGETGRNGSLGRRRKGHDEIDDHGFPRPDCLAAEEVTGD